MLVVQVLVAWPLALLVPTSMLSRASMAFAPRAAITSTPRVSVVCAAASAVDYWPVVAPPPSGYVVREDQVPASAPGRTLATVRHGLVPRPEGVTLYRDTNGEDASVSNLRLRPAVLTRMCTARVARSQPGVLSANACGLPSLSSASSLTRASSTSHSSRIGTRTRCRPARRRRR